VNHEEIVHQLIESEPQLHEQKTATSIASGLDDFAFERVLLETGKRGVKIDEG